MSLQDTYQSRKNLLASNLTSMGVTASGTEGLTNLIEKINSIPTISITKQAFFTMEEQTIAVWNGTQCNTIDSTMFPIITIPTNWSLEWEWKANSNNSYTYGRIGIVPYANLSNGNPQRTIHFQYDTENGSGELCYGNRSTSTNTVGRISTSVYSYHKCKLIGNGNIISAYIDDNYKGNMNLSWISSYNPYVIGIFGTSNTGVNFDVKNVIFTIL